MPIFDNNGKKQNVQDAYIGKYMELYPDATTIMERDGKKYRVKAKDYNTFLGDTLQAPKMESAPQTVTAPQVEADKSEYTFTGEQLGIDDIVQEQRDKVALRTYNELPTEDHSYELHGNTPYRELLEVGKKMNALDAADPENKAALDALKYQEALLLRDIASMQQKVKEENEKSFGEKVGEVINAIPDAAGELGAKAVGAVTAPVYAVGEFVGDAVDNVTGWDGMHKTMRAGRKKAEEALFGGTEGALALRNDILYKNGKDGELSLLGTVLQSTEEMAGGATTPVYDLLEKVGDVTGLEGVESVGKEGRRQYKENILADSWKKEDSFFGQAAQLVPQVAAIWGGIATGNPALMKAGTGIQVASSMGQAAHEAAEAGASGAQIFGASALNGIIELLTERIPLGRWLKKIPVNIGSEVVSKASTEVLEGEAEALFKEAKKRLGNKLTAKSAKEFAIDMASEGGSEFAAEFLQTLVPIIYKDAEEYPTFHEALQNGIDGLLGGIMMSGMIQPVASYTQRKADHIRRKEQGFVDVAQIKNAKDQYEVVEIVGENESGEFIGKRDNELVEVHPSVIVARRQFDYDAFRKNEMMEYSDEGYSQEPTGGNALAVANEYTNARGEVVRALGLADDDDVDAFIGDRKPEEIAQGDEDTEMAITHYLQARARRDGFRERYQEERDRQFEESDKSIDGRSNNGSVYTTMLGDQQVHITGGDVVLNEDGTIDVNNSSESLFVEFPDGSKKPVTPDKFTDKVAMEYADELKVAGRAAIEEKWKAEFDNAENAYIEQQKRAEGIVFDITDDKGTHRVEVVKEDNNISNILVDGEQMQISTEELNALRGEAGLAQTESGEVEGENEVQPEAEGPKGENAEKVVESAQPTMELSPAQKREEVLKRIPTKGNERLWTEAEPADVAEYIRLLTADPAKQQAAADKFIADIKAKQEKVDAISALEMDEQIAYWESVKALLQGGQPTAETAPVVEETQAPVVESAPVAEVETPQATNEMQEADLTEDVKTEDANQSENNLEMVAEGGNAPGQSGVYADNQGNPVDADGKLIVDEVNSIDEITDEDFETPTRNVQLPVIPENVANAIGTNGRPVVIKRNVFEKNGNTHVELEPEDSRNILRSALYNPNLVGSTQPIRRPDYKVAIRTGDQNAVVVLDVYQEKDFVEIVGWRMVNEKGLAKMQRQAEREGGQFLILSPNDGSAAALSALPLGLSSASEDINSVSNSQENAQKSGENTTLEQIKAELKDLRKKIAVNGNKLKKMLHLPKYAQLTADYKYFNEYLDSMDDDRALDKLGIIKRAWNADAFDALWAERELLKQQIKDAEERLKNAESRKEKEESTPEIQEPRSVEENLDNGDKRITSYNSRGEVATVAIERDGKVVSVDSYDEGVLFEHTEYDGNGKASSVTRYDKQGNVVGTQVYEDGKAKTPMQRLADRILDRTEEKRRIPLRERARELEAQVGVKANIIESLDEVKNREARKRIAAGEPVAGWYSGGQVYLYMPNIKDRREIELTYVHEVVAHHGVKKLLGDRFNEFLDGVWKMMSEADRARMLAYVGANENPALQDMRAAADEYVAELAEEMNLGELEQSTWDKIVDWFKELLENIGFENLTKEDIESMLKASYANLRSTEQGAQSKENDFRARMTFHGSGAQFDRFDHAFMGTGEGAQAFGWGTYVTEVEGIGRTYATMMRDKAISDKHRENAIINNLARQVLASNNGDKNAALEELRNLLNESWSDKKRVKAEIKIIETGKFLPESKVKANLYSVEIPDDNGSNYLHWEDVVPKKVETAVKERLLERLSEGQGEAYKSDLKQELDDVFRYSDFDGASLYKNISAYLGGDKQASLFLNDMGFVGISYPANTTTGGRADGARNYVIFNENDAEIKDRTMFRKKDSERRQEKRRINDIIDTAAGFITVGGKKQATKNRLKKEAERKELAKEMYSSVLKGDFNDVTLSQIDKFIEDATPANPFGRRISQRLPQRMERALRQGARTNAVDALFSRISESAVPANERFSEAGRREIEERKKELLKGWAIATGNWHTDLKEFTDDTEPIGEGKDSKVYSSKDGRYVIKASKGKPYGKRFRPDIDNIALFNDVFRDTRYEILGYGEIDGEFVRILQQPIVDFAQSTPLTSEERGEYMQSLGFEPLNDANTAFADGEIVIADLQKGNVVRDAAGNISVIDADAKLHTKDVGGDYTYPPVEEDLPEQETRFRIANENQDIFVSNAQRAVEGIQQNKATAEQWIAMLKKNGGLKAGEDAWLGLEEWLNEKQGAVTKQEILDYIAQNRIQIEEVQYDENAIDIDNVFDEYEEIYDLKGEEEAHKVMIERYGENFFEAFKEIGGELRVQNDKLALQILKNEINSTRLGYTTDGLENKREIALVVPTIESWNASDEVHFGDAGNGRAVAWVRFGETTDSEGNRVLMIDEIQSKRHQDAREKGYKNASRQELESAVDAWDEAQNRYDAYNAEMAAKYGTTIEDWPAVATDAEIERYEELYNEVIKAGDVQEQIAENFHSGVPAAPFEKNWHELAMKRMLRLAAEEGFDKVAWTTGEQQAERYNIGNVIDGLTAYKIFPNGYYVVPYRNRVIDSLVKIYNDIELAETFGKEIATDIVLNAENATEENPYEIKGDGLRIGGEGMKGFYDKMLPSFVQKYTKKWGAKVGEVTMPSLGENNTMWSVDVTPEMQESVMQGQTMFRMVAYDKAVQIAEEFANTHKGATKRVVISKGKESLEQQMRDAGFTDFSIEVALKNYEGEENPTDGAYYVSSDGIVIYDAENLNATLWHENAHRAIHRLLGDNLSELQRAFDNLPKVLKDRTVAFLEAKGYTPEEFPKEAVAFFIEGAYTDGVFNDGNYDITRFFKGVDDNVGVFYNFVQNVINNIEYEREETDNSGIYLGESTQQQLPERNGESYENGRGADATEGAAGSGTQEGEARFRTGKEEKLSPEEKERQRKLKDNAKAIRRLHNVKSNYPITALRNLGFALETQEQREEHDRLFAERDAISGRQNAVSAEVNPQSMTLMERITESLMKAAVQNKENVDMRMSAIRAYSRDLSNVLKLMRAQRGYDRNTVRMFTNLVKMYLRNNSMSGMSSYDITRLLGLIERANGGYGPQVMRAAEQIAEIITKSHTRELENIVRKQIKTGAEKVNASGVVVQGGVDVVGKRVLNTFRDAINMTSEEEFEKAFREAFERAAKFPNDVEAKAACDAMVIAKEYRDNIIEAKKQESELLKSINQYSDIRSRYDRGEITRREYNEFVDAVRKSLIELRSRMVDDYQRIIHALGGDISEGIKRAKEFRERELARVEKIHNMAEADMSGVSKSAERKKRGFWRKATDYAAFKNPLAKVIAEGLGTYNEFMKFFGRNAIGGKGRLYDYFIGRYTEVQNQEWVEKQKDIKKIDERCEMVFGKGFMDVMRDSEKNSGVVLEYWNGGERVSRDLSIGQLMYIYMTAKQTDGEMKLRGMGITEEKVNKAVAVLPAKYKVFADWVQSDFLPEMRPRLNEVHKRMFGASMSEVKNYFPLVVNTDARQAEVDLNSVMPINPSTITGSIIKRKVNATPLNLESNAFDVLLNHVSDMEHWAAFAEFTRDNNTLIGDKDFMNRVKNSRDLRFGDGEAIWNNFVETARITTGNYRAKTDEWANVMKGVSSAKITFGYYTALKQFLSSPGMWLEASTASIIKATVNPLGSWRWAIENLPGFEERWKGRTAGNERLADSDSDWSIWDNSVVKAAREAGMAPNAFIDAVVVSTGARAVYDSRKRFYKALGLSQEEQHKRALKDAAVAYNETQQSAQGAYLSILQKEGGFKAMVMTLYRNSQMAYSRKVTGSMAELYKKAVRWKAILDDEEKKYLEMGLSEEDAKKEANKALLKSTGKDVATLVMFGYVLNMVWYLGEQLPYLLFGDDEEEKEKIMDTALKIGATGMFEGFALGNVAKDLYVKGVTGNRYRSDMLTTPFASDAEKIINRFANDGTLAGMSQLLILGAETATGISPQRLVDDVAAVIDFCNGDLDKATEVTLLTTRLAKVPQSQIDKLYLEEVLGGDVVALAERYAEYKRLRDYPLNIGDDKILKKYAERFKKAHNEDLKEIVRDENAYEGYFSNASPEEKIKLAGYRGEYLEELTGKKAEEVLTGRELVYYTLYGRKEQNLVYSAMTTPDDVDDEICIEMMMSELKPIYEGLEKAEDRTAYANEHQKEIGLYKTLDEIERGVGNCKSAMKKIGEEYPDYAHDFMTIIRELRAKAIELINKYRNNE